MFIKICMFINNFIFSLFKTKFFINFLFYFINYFGFRKYSRVRWQQVNITVCCSFSNSELEYKIKTLCCSFIAHTCICNAKKEQELYLKVVIYKKNSIS